MYSNKNIAKYRTFDNINCHYHQIHTNKDATNSWACRTQYLTIMSLHCPDDQLLDGVSKPGIPSS